MNAVLDHLGLGDELEEQARPGAVNSLDQDRRVVFWIIDPVGSQASELLLVVGGHLVVVQHLRPEPGGRCRVPAVDNDVMQVSHVTIIQDYLGGRCQAGLRMPGSAGGAWVGVAGAGQLDA